MPTISIGDGSIHYREAGSGNDVVVLVHAFPLHSEMWEPQLSALAATFRVIAPDQRGLGGSGPAPAAATMELIAGDIASLLRSLGIRRACFAGLSMGGYVTLELWRRAPGLFRALALCDTKATPDTIEAKEGRETFARNALEKGIGWVADDFAPKLLRPQADPAVDRRVREIIATNSPAGVAAAQRGMAARPDSVPTLPLITCPTIAVRGAEDGVTSEADLSRIAQTVKGARLITIPGAGHLPNLENPAAFNATLSTFFAAAPR
jgi:pimeloyl-ACP methyl ester carboxylesterase